MLAQMMSVFFAYDTNLSCGCFEPFTFDAVCYSWFKSRLEICDVNMGAHKTSARKIRIIKKTKQTSSVPAWVIARTRRSVRTNPKRRDWRHAHARLG